MNFQKISKQQYKQYLNKALFKTFFNSPEWQDVLNNEFDSKFIHLNYQDKLILSIPRFQFYEYSALLPLTHNIDFQEFKKDFLKECGLAELSIHPHIAKSYFINITESDINKTHLKTFYLEDINKKNTEILFSFRKTLRHEIRKAEKDHLLNVRHCYNIVDLEKFYRIYEKSINSKGNLPLPFACFNKFFENDKVEIILAYYAGEVIGGSVFLHYDKFIHYFINAVDNKFKSLHSSYLILWHKISSSMGGKYQIFDFGGTRKNSKLEIFKRGWGTVEEPIITIYSEEKKAPSNFKRNLWKFLPMPRWVRRLLIKQIAKRL